MESELHPGETYALEDTQPVHGLPLRTHIGRNILSYLDGYYEGQRDARLTGDPLVPVDQSHFGAGYRQGVEDYRRGIRLVLR